MADLETTLRTTGLATTPAGLVVFRGRGFAGTLMKEVSLQRRLAEGVRRKPHEALW